MYIRVLAVTNSLFKANDNFIVITDNNISHCQCTFQEKFIFFGQKEAKNLTKEEFMTGILRTQKW